VEPLILKRFKELGLGCYEAKAYLSLLEKETLTVTEVSRLADIPRANAYEALEKLLSKGFCVSKPGDIKRYSASPPSLLQERMLADINQAMDEELEGLEGHRREVAGRWRQAVEDVGNVTGELTPLFEGSRSQDIPLEYIEVLKDPLQIHRKIMELSAQCREEILFFTKPPYSGYGTASIEEQENQQTTLMQAGVDIRSLYEISTDREERAWQIRRISVTVSNGEKAREIDKLPMKLAIFDRQISALPLEDPTTQKQSLTTLIIEHAGLAMGLKMLFECYWVRSREILIPEGIGGLQNEGG
jgi:predicted transcriptional regulator